MRSETVKKYVKDINGLVKEISNVIEIPEAPKVYETSVIFLFGRIFRYLNFDDIIFGDRYAEGFDAIAVRNLDYLTIEFEAYSRNFQEHHHEQKKCKLIVCWEDDWNEECPIDVLEMRYFWKIAQKRK